MFLSSKPPGFSSEGYHIARAFSLVEYGTIFISTKWQHQVRLTWEMPMDTRDYHPGRPPAPKQISKDYASSLYGASWLKRHLISWRGADIVDQLDRSFDPMLFIGAACQIKIEHKKNNNDLWYEEVTDVIPLPEHQCPPQHNQTRIFTIKNFDKVLFDKLPDFVARKIMRSREFDTMGLQKLIDQNNAL